MSDIDNYRHQEALDNQEVVTPRELVDYILSHLSDEDFDGDIMDPCIGPGALSLPILSKNFRSFTVCDIQDEHLEDFSELLDKKGIEHHKEYITKGKAVEIDEW